MLLQRGMKHNPKNITPLICTPIAIFQLQLWIKCCFMQQHKFRQLNVCNPTVSPYIYLYSGRQEIGQQTEWWKLQLRDQM